ncbi:helix-turn-helix domain-containing protein [Lacibacterium aquatile]|uniref:Helix-turn-helix domain-containing protein n=1 Tax=Lacibacterium aquatile TaxID=1168082 RepID=A0ABW5DU12_9PROT
MSETLDERLGERLADLRIARGWSLDELAERSGVSRATLSRVERGETSATAVMLGKLCAAFGWTLSRLMMAVEPQSPALVAKSEQPVWTDPATGFVRRAISPPTPELRGEMIMGTLPPGAVIAYDRPPSIGLEHHLYLLEGMLDLAVGGVEYRLSPGDCLRYRLTGPSRFVALGDVPARYVIAIIAG